MNEEIKEWKVTKAKTKVAGALILDGTSFSYNEEDGIVFAAPEGYVADLVYRMKVCYGAKNVVIEEYKG